MDPVGLNILLTEMEADCTVIHDAAIKAAARLGADGEGRLEACAYEEVGIHPEGRRCAGSRTQRLSSRRETRV